MISGQVWIVDYDLPSNPTRIRVAFYRAVRKALKDLGIEHWEFSTASVVVVDDEAIARTIHIIAKQYGKSNLYRGFNVPDA